MKLEGRVAIVTGAAQGIGERSRRSSPRRVRQVVSRRLNGEGADERRGRAAAALAIQADIAQRGAGREPHGGGDTRALRQDRRARQRRSDRAVHPLGRGRLRLLAQDHLGQPRRRLPVSRAAERPMREAGYGRIVHIASNAVLAGTPNMGPYLARRAASSASRGHSPPSSAATGSPPTRSRPASRATEGALATPHPGRIRLRADRCRRSRGTDSLADIAPAVAFLASEESGWITGQLIVVDAGHIRN